MPRLDNNKVQRSSDLGKNFPKFRKVRGENRRSFARAVGDLQRITGMPKGQAISALIPRGSRLTF